MLSFGARVRTPRQQTIGKRKKKQSEANVPYFSMKTNSRRGESKGTNTFLFVATHIDKTCA